jgi:hypothetical protein
MTAPQMTRLVAAIIIIVVVTYDLLAFYIWGGEATISTQVLELSQKYPIVAFAIGVLIGHMFWPQSD